MATGDQEQGNGSFHNDHVDQWNPVSFGVAFARRMRRHKGVAHAPSLRTALAVPSLLTARYARLRALHATDYVAAAVLCSPPEDQTIADAIARDLVFPKAATEAPAATQEVASAAPVVAAEVDAADPLAGLLGDLADLSIDLDDVDDLEDLFAEDEAQVADAFELFETLYSSADARQRALGELVASFGGAAELDAAGAATELLVEAFVKERLEAHMEHLNPTQIQQACHAGFGGLMCRLATQPWALAGALAGSGRQEALQTHLDELLKSATAREAGKTLQYLMPHKDTERFETFKADCLGKAADLSDHAELLGGLDEWIEPADALFDASIADAPRRGLQAARWMSQQFGESLEARVFQLWLDSLETPPTLDQLGEMAVDCPAWHETIDAALARRLTVMRLECSTAKSNAAPMPDSVIHDINTGHGLSTCGVEHGVSVARRLATEGLCSLWDRPQFLPMLDEWLEHKIIPFDIKRLADHAEHLGIPPSEVYDRIGDALVQLKQLIESNGYDAARYRMLVDRVDGLSDDMAAALAQGACSNNNLEALAALLAVNMGATAEVMPDDQVCEALGYKGIGGGPNLLKQWFTHQSRLSDGLKAQIKGIAKEALIDLAFNWIGKGDGSCESGLVPQSRSRPFRVGDELDSLDMESTLDAIISSGKALDSVTLDDLFVSDTSKGRAVLTVLIDISGSMSGSELAMCAIAVVMLLGKLRSDEVALAVFESNTHVIKNIDEPTDLDVVADKILDLTAYGGTRVDAALRWATTQFAAAHEADVRVLFLLSDFYFFEDETELMKLGSTLTDQGVSLLAAAHGYSDKRMRSALLQTIGGRPLDLSSLERLPELLLDTLTQIGDGMQ